MEKGEIAHNKQFLLFPQYFLLRQIIVSPLVHIFDILFLFAAEFEEPKIGISGKGLIFYQTTKGKLDLSELKDPEKDSLFLPIQKLNWFSEPYSFMSSAITFNMVKVKNYVNN